MYCRPIIHGVNIEYQNLVSPLDQKRRYLTLQAVWRQSFIFEHFYVLIVYMYFNLNNFNDTVNRLTVVKS
jgi:hypothetical protein